MSCGFSYFFQDFQRGKNMNYNNQTFFQSCWGFFHTVTLNSYNFFKFLMWILLLLLLFVHHLQRCKEIYLHK